MNKPFSALNCDIVRNGPLAFTRERSKESSHARFWSFVLDQYSRSSAAEETPPHKKYHFRARFSILACVQTSPLPQKKTGKETSVNRRR